MLAGLAGIVSLKSECLVLLASSRWALTGQEKPVSDEGLWRKLNGLSSPVCLGFAFITGHLACITSRLGLWLVAFRARLGLNDSMLKVAKGCGHNHFGEPAWPNEIFYVFPVVIAGVSKPAIGSSPLSSSQLCDLAFHCCVLFVCLRVAYLCFAFVGQHMAHFSLGLARCLEIQSLGWLA